MKFGKNADIFTYAEYGEFQDLLDKFSIEDLNKRNAKGFTLLHCAIGGRKFETAKFLIDKGIDVNATNLYGQTSLHFVCLFPNIDIAKKILLHGGNINVRDKYGNNALWVAVMQSKGKDYELVELFMKYNPDIHSKNNAGKSPLDFAQQIGDSNLLNLLTKH